MVYALRICNLMVENLREKMKLQVEKYLIILMDIVIADPSKGTVYHYVNISYDDINGYSCSLS